MATHALHPAFIEDLKSGMLSSLLRKIYQDATLDLQLRGRSINVYYRGISLIKVFRQLQGYKAFFSEDSYSDKNDLHRLDLNSEIKSARDCEHWTRRFPQIKDMIDRYLGRDRGSEEDTRQALARVNNYSNIANTTDYYILDTEYKAANGAKFDLVLLRWEADGAKKKLQGGYRPQLGICELKDGHKSVSNKCGIKDHFHRMHSFLRESSLIEALKADMAQLMRQKHDLKLFPQLKEPCPVHFIDEEIRAVLLLANYHQDSEALRTELRKIDEDRSLDSFLPSVDIIQASLLGYGLFKEGVVPFIDFRKHLGTILGLNE